MPFKVGFIWENCESEQMGGSFSASQVQPPTFRNKPKQLLTLLQIQMQKVRIKSSENKGNT